MGYRERILAEPSLLGYWRLDDLSGPTADELGVRNSAAIGAGTTRGVPGGLTRDSNRAMTFNGTTGYVDLVGQGIVLAAGDWSMEVLVNPNTLGVGAWHHFLGGDLYSYALGCNGSTLLATIASQADAPSSLTAIPLGVWTRVGASFRKSDGQLIYYVNGVPVRTVSFPTVPTNQASKMRYFGGGGIPYPNWFDGSLDEIAVFGAVLPASTFYGHYLESLARRSVRGLTRSGSVAQLVRAGIAATYPSVIMADKPAAYWRMGAALDYLGLHPLSQTNLATFGVAGALPFDLDGAVGFPGNAAQFARTAANDLPIATTVGSLELWCKPTLPSGGAFNLSQIAAVTGANSGFGVGVGLVSDGGAGSQLIGLNPSAAWVPTGVSLASLSGTWVHMVVTRDAAGVMRYYVNGALAFTSAPGILCFAPTTYVQVGSDTGGARGFNGPIDEVAIYPTVLTDAQVLAHYRAAFAPPVPGQVLRPALGPVSVRAT